MIVEPPQRNMPWVNPADGTLTIYALQYLDRLTQLNCTESTATVTDDALIEGEDFDGDTAVTLESATVTRLLMGELAAFSARIDIRGFSAQADTDESFSFRFDIGGLAESEGWSRPNIAADGYGHAEGLFVDIGTADFPRVPFRCFVRGKDSASNPNTVAFINEDRSSFASTAGAADQLVITFGFVAKVSN